MARKTRRTRVLTAIVAAPAEASLDEGGATASSGAASRVEVTSFHSGDAAVGIGIGFATGALTFRGELATHRRRAGSPDTSHTAVR